MTRRSITNLAVACLLILIGIASRLVPHAPNFTAVGALTLFTGFYFADRKLGLAIPLLTLALSDLVAGAYELPLMAAVYASSLMPWVVGRTLRSHCTPARVALCAIGSSVGFFISTNFSV